MTFIIPNRKSLLKNFSNQKVIIHTEKINEISEILNNAAYFNLKLEYIWVKSFKYISEIEFLNEWKEIPLFFIIQGIGSFKIFFNKLNTIKNLNIIFGLSITDDRVLRDVRILASLGYNCELEFNKDEIDWDKIHDITIYALYGKIPRGKIDPFNNIVTELKNTPIYYYSNGYFNNPIKYIHISNDGKIALTSNDLINEKFLDCSIELINKEDFQKYIQDWMLNRRLLLSEFNKCSVCEGWKACCGGLRNFGNNLNGCEKIFSEIYNYFNFITQNKIS